MIIGNIILDSIPYNFRVREKNKNGQISRVEYYSSLEGALNGVFELLLEKGVNKDAKDVASLRELITKCKEEIKQEINKNKELKSWKR